jgi:Ca2+-binding EF-hand superfamily protein
MGQSNSKSKSDKIPPLLDETQFFTLWTISDVKELHKRFRIQINGFAIVEAQFESILAFKPELTKYVEFEDLFEILDNDHDGRLDGLELLGGIAQVSNSTFEEKCEFCFELFDFNLNATLSQKELLMMMMSCINGINMFTGGGEELECDIDFFEALADDAFSRADRDGNGQITYNEFVYWARSNRELMSSLEALSKLSSDARVNVNPEDSASDTDEGELSDANDDSDSTQQKPKQSVRNMSDSLIELEASKGDKKLAVVSWKGQVHEPTNFKLSKSNLDGPDTNLELHWVFGYRAQSSRNNLRYVTSDSNSKSSLIVYPAAALGMTFAHFVMEL